MQRIVRALSTVARGTTLPLVEQQAPAAATVLRMPWVQDPLSLPAGLQRDGLGVIVGSGLTDEALELPALDELDGESMECAKTKRTFGKPTVLKWKRTHGFLQRMATPSGRRVIQRRVAKGRWHVTTR